MTDAFGILDLGKMNESDVEQVIVRPLLHHLGFRQGTENNIRTQISLRYEKAYLGHKSDKDPVLRGRPDFICEVISFGRWVIEAKAPSHPLSLEDSQQAHTYASHPEIAAEFYVLTNGREFKVYRIGQPDESKFSWHIDETDEILPALKNLLGPEAIKKRAQLKIDLGKPLTSGLPSKLRLVGGNIVYEKNTTNIPMSTGQIDGLRNPISGVGVERTGDGRILATLKLESAFSALDAINKMMGTSDLQFFSSDEFISRDISKPTIFQNLLSAGFPTGTNMPAFGGNPAVRLPFAVDAVCFTQASGFIESDHFKGTFEVDYDFKFHLPPMLAGRLPSPTWMKTQGTFDLIFVNE